MSDIDLHRLRRELAGSSIGHTIHYHTSVPSTMPLAHELVGSWRGTKTAALCGGIVLTEEQTAGRGRLKRQWQAPRGSSLLTSTLLLPPLLPQTPTQLPMLAGLALLDAVALTVPALARHLRLKWPNDLVVLGDGTVGKLAGILIEGRFAHPPVMSSPGRLPYAVLGIGINVNQLHHQLPPPREQGLGPTSLRALLRRPVCRETLLVHLCGALAALLEPQHQEPQILHQRWQSLLINMQRRVQISGSGPDQLALSGRVVDTTIDGDLVIDGDDGRQRTVRAGDVLIQWPGMAAP